MPGPVGPGIKGSFCSRLKFRKIGSFVYNILACITDSLFNRLALFFKNFNDLPAFWAFYLFQDRSFFAFLTSV